VARQGAAAHGLFVRKVWQWARASGGLLPTAAATGHDAAAAAADSQAGAAAGAAAASAAAAALCGRWGRCQAVTRALGQTWARLGLTRAWAHRVGPRGAPSGSGECGGGGEVALVAAGGVGTGLEELERVRWAGMKWAGRALEKAARCYGEDAAQLCDVVRQVRRVCVRELAARECARERARARTCNHASTDEARTCTHTRTNARARS
jgi:hypothetical protein